MKRITKLFYCLIGLVLIAYALSTYYFLFWGAAPLWLTPNQTIGLLLGGCGLTTAAGFFLFAKGLLTRRRLPALVKDRQGGAVLISPKALRNITFTAVERFDGILEDRVRVRILRGNPPTYRIKIWLGIAEYSTLPAQHQAIRDHVAAALEQCTGVSASRIDLIFYTAHVERAHSEGGIPQ